MVSDSRHMQHCCLISLPFTLWQFLCQIVEVAFDFESIFHFVFDFDQFLHSKALFGHLSNFWRSIVYNSDLPESYCVPWAKPLHLLYKSFIIPIHLFLLKLHPPNNSKQSLALRSVFKKLHDQSIRLFTIIKPQSRRVSILIFCINFYY